MFGRVSTRLSIISIFSNLASFWECMVLKWYDWAPCICGIHANTKILWPLDRESNAQPNINQKVDHCTWGWFWWVSKNNNWSEIPVHWLFTKIKKTIFNAQNNQFTSTEHWLQFNVRFYYKLPCFEPDCDARWQIVSTVYEEILASATSNSNFKFYQTLLYRIK